VKTNNKKKKKIRLSFLKMSDFFKKGSPEYSSITNKCISQKKSINAYLLCGQCWAFLTPYQKTKHTNDHDKIFTASQYCSEELIISIAKKFGKHKEEQGMDYLVPIKDCPLKCFQNVDNNKKEVKGEKKFNSLKDALNSLNVIKIYNKL